VGQRSLKVIENGIIRKLGYGFLFAFSIYYGAISYRFRDIASYLSKIANFFIHQLYLAPPPRKGDFVGISPRCLMLIKLEWLGYRVMNKLWPYIWAVSIEYRNVTDRRTDRQNCYINIARQCADSCACTTCSNCPELPGTGALTPTRSSVSRPRWVTSIPQASYVPYLQVLATPLLAVFWLRRLYIFLIDLLADWLMSSVAECY